MSEVRFLETLPQIEIQIYPDKVCLLYVPCTLGWSTYRALLPPDTYPYPRSFTNTTYPVFVMIQISKIRLRDLQGHTYHRKLYTYAHSHVHVPLFYLFLPAKILAPFFVAFGDLKGSKWVPVLSGQAPVVRVTRHHANIPNAGAVRDLRPLPPSSTSSSSASFLSPLD